MNFLNTLISNIFPLVAHAQNFGGTTTSTVSFRSIVSSIIQFIDKSIMPLLVALGVIYFLVNIIYYIYSMDNEAKRTEFRKYSINAIIALFILLSLWGIIGIVTTTLFNHAPLVPQLQTNDSGGISAPQ